MTEAEAKQELLRMHHVDIIIGDCYMNKTTGQVYTVDFISPESIGFQHGSIKSHCTVRRAIVPCHFQKIVYEPRSSQ